MPHVANPGLDALRAHVALPLLNDLAISDERQKLTGATTADVEVASIGSAGVRDRNRPTVKLGVGLALAIAGLEVVVLGVGDHANSTAARFVGAHDSSRRTAGGQTGDAGRSTDVEALVGVAVVGIEVELATDLDLLVRGAEFAKGDRLLAGANDLEIIESTLSRVVPAKVEVAVAAVELSVGGDLGTPAGKVGVHVETIRFVTLDACLPGLDDDAGLGGDLSGRCDGW